MVLLHEWEIRVNSNQQLEKAATPYSDSAPKGVSKLLGKLAARFAVPTLTTKRIWFAFTVAAITDAIQLGLGPVGWAFADQTLDVIAMVLTCGALGFHMLLLPTFVIEFIPVADMLPTWTGCVGAVVILRKRAQSRPPPMPLVTAPIAALPPALPAINDPSLPQPAGGDSPPPAAGTT